jgi:hypothetical protein
MESQPIRRENTGGNRDLVQRKRHGSAHIRAE